MANTLLTNQIITNEAVRLWRNTNAFIQSLDTQYDDQFARDGAKIGTQLRIRLPNDYVIRTGPAASPQGTSEQNVTLVVATQAGVDTSFSSAERTMSIQNYAERILAPKVNTVAGYVASTIMQGVEGGVSNYVSNVDGSGNVIAPTADTVLRGGASLSTMSAAMMGRNVVTDPFSMAKLVNSLSGLFNPSAKISRQYDTGQIYDALNFKWMEDQTVLKHTTGTFSAGGTVNGASQTGLTVTVNAITGTLVAGDIITFAGVNSVNRITKQSNGTLAQFVVTANVASGATSIPIYPAIIPASSGNPVQYQTVDVSPANGAAMALVNKASETYRKNIGFAPQAITMATADLIMPKNQEDSGRQVLDGVSMRMLTSYIPGTDQLLDRLDVLFGFLFIRPEWGVVIADSVP